MILVEVFTNLTASTCFKNHIEWTDYGLKTSKQVPNYSILKTLLSTISSINYFFIEQKKITNCKDEVINLSNIYYLIYSGARRVFRKITQHKRI